MPTGIGLLFLAAGLYCAIRRPGILLPLLVFSAIFPATSAVTFGTLWVMPYYLLAPIFIVSQWTRRNGRARTKLLAKPFLAAFGVIGVLSAFLLPLVFAGTPVFSPRLGTSDLEFTTFPLVFSVGNIAQAGYLTVNILVVLTASTMELTDGLWRWLDGTFYCLSGSIVLELICLLTAIPYPYSIIENTPDRSSLALKILDPTQRLQGTCGEPSFAGLVLVIFVAAYFYRYYSGKGGGWKVLLGTTCILLVRSSSALVALGIVLVAIVVLHLPLRFPVLLRWGRFKRLIPVFLILAGCVSSSAFLLLFQQWVIDKPTSGSYTIRTTLDHYALVLLGTTHGLGIGLGSYRGSSLAASLAGTMGVLGLLLFGLVMLQFLISVPREKAWLRWALIAGLIDMGIAIPDITQPILWSMLAVAAYLSVRRSPELTASLRTGLGVELEGCDSVD